ncbi:MAG TPA: hypothetical protein VFZ38_08680 [Vicinamibacterales bacterium]
MTNKPDKDFGKRRPVSAPATPQPGPPAKRSGHVALLLMGTFAVGSAAYALMPSRSCERPPNAPQPSLLQSNANATECPPRSSSSSGGSGGSSSSRSSYYSGSSSSSHSSSSPSSSGTTDSGSHAVARGGFGAFAHSFGSHFSSGS